ncbi:MAG: BamA/TamA family outer membrane protein [Rhodothermales bacterium]
MSLLRTVILVVLLGWIPAAPSLAQYNYHFGRNKIQYDDFDWKVMRTEHFDVYYYPEMLELAEHGAYFAEEAYEEMRHRFNFSLNTRVPIIFYSSNLHFKQTNITPGFIPDGVGGFFEFLKGRVVIPANGNLQRFRRVVRHEMVHVFTYNKLVRVMRDHRRPMTTFLPLWFTEGLAEYWSGPPDQQHEMVIRDAVFTNYLVPLESMFRIRGSYVMYKQGEAIMRFISEEYGEEKILGLIEGFWKDRKFDVVLEVTLQEPFEDIAARWLAWVKRQYYPEMSDVDVPSLIASGLSTEGFNAKPSFHRFPDGRRFVYFVGNRGGYSNVFSVQVDAEYEPLDDPEILIEGERSDEFEAFHLFESRIAVSSGGKLAFVTKSGNRDVIHVWDLYANRLEDTYRFERIIAAYSPTWSPDGTALAFTSIGENGFSDIHILDRTSGRLHPLTDDAWDDRDPSWSPDGHQVAFSSDRTGVGPISAYNIFTYDLEREQIDYVTYGHRVDLSPTWSPDGRHVAFISSQPDSTGRFSGQDIWVADMTAQPAGPDLERPLVRLTRLASAAMDPVWTADDHLVFTSFEGLEFSIRHLADVDSLLADPKRIQRIGFTDVGEPWTFDRIEIGEDATAGSYKTRYQLDIAQASVGQSSVLGTTGGALVAFSDMLGNDYLNFTLFNTGTSQRSFLEDLSFQVAKYDFGKRANTGFGAYRFSGLRYDVTDPDAPTTFPRFHETIYGGFGAVSYPISKFRRLELGTSLNWSRKEIGIRNIDRDAWLLSNSLSITHDETLYWLNGPVSGWRGRATLAYTTDVVYSNVSYFTLSADVRTYIRLHDQVTFASWFMGRMNEGREARLFVMGGSWDLRGFRFFEVRGQKIWFTSQELRFPLVNAPSVFLPFLAPFGVASLRGALFFDAAHAWNDGYRDVRPEINAGETIGAAGLGFRMNLFGAFVLRYDIGRRYRDGFRVQDKVFRQFMFGWDF